MEAGGASSDVVAGSVDEPVVVGAQQGKVRERGDAAVFPPGDVVGVGAVVGGVAAGELAAAPGSGVQGGEHRRGGEAAGAADVEGLAVVVGDDELQVGLLGQVAEGGVADGAAAEDPGGPRGALVGGDGGAVEEVGEGGGDDEQRPGLAPPRGEGSVGDERDDRGADELLPGAGVFGELTGAPPGLDAGGRLR